MTNLKKILSSLNVQVENTKEQKNIYDIFSRIDSNYTFDDFIGESDLVKDLLSYCKQAAKTLHPVLICGETGTGKEIIANAFHSATLDHLFTPFVKINCSAIPKELLESELFGYEKGAFTGALTSKKGKFELASGGAILLDEIGEMELSLQSKLLRVIEEREFEKVGGNVLLPLNARIIASTNQDLLSQVEKGLFRRDLYYRLNTIEIILPPLRARIEDIPILVKHFIKKNDLNLEFSEDALDVFMQYSWPGNVRELKHIIDRLTFIKSDSIVSGDEAKEILKITEISNLPSAGPAPISIEQHERNIIAGALNANFGNISDTAKQLGISRATLYNKINKYNLKHEKRFST